MLTVKEILQQLKTGKITKAQALDILEQAKSRDANRSNPTHRQTATPLAEPIQTYLIQKLQAILDVDADQFVITENFMDLGIDSTQLIGLVQEIENEVVLELYPTMFFEYQNIESLSAFLAQEYREPFASFLKMDSNQTATHQPEVRPVSISKPPFISPMQAGDTIPFVSLAGAGVQVQKHKDETHRDGKSEPIAVIGMAGVFPQSPDVATFWQHLYHKTNLITEIPTDHFDYRPWYDPDFQVEDKLYCKWGSFIEDVDKFDAGFFNISPREAELMDPQLRYLLQVLVHTAEDAGYGAAIRGSHTGVYVGACFHDYADEMIRRGKTVQAHDATGNAATMLANRPSFYFDLTGPSLAIDTACSSSLVALHYACQALQQGECDMAFAAGVNLLLSSGHYRYFCSLGALSPTGRCHTFDERADGYVPGEAIAAVLLKPLSQAVEDGDQIYGIIKGSALGHGGYTPSITAPSVDGEAKVLLAAWQAAGINPETLGYIEAHGTGTKLGDPIEITALNKAFRTHTAKEGFCGIGSAKAHLGHTEGAAGIVGLIKALLAIRHGIIPAMPQFERLNPYIQLEQSPFYINQEPVEWPGQANLPRRAGVSSFGFGGAYAHVVVEEAPVPKDEGEKMKDEGGKFQPSSFIPHPYLFVLSARDEERLRAYAQKMLAFLEQVEQSVEVMEPSPTIQQAVRAMVSEITGADPDDIEVEQSFAGYGLDPVQLSRLRTMVEERYDCELPLDLISGQASVGSVVQHLASLATEGEQAARQPAMSLASIAYTLQVGREAMEARLALVVSSVEELIERLSQYDQTQPSVERVYQGHTRVGKRTTNLLIEGETGAAFIKAVIDKREFDKLAQLWVSGVDIDWHLLHGREKPQRIRLPMYPFARERYWMYTNEQLAINNDQLAIDALHPLVHQNISTLTEQRFSTLFTGAEFFLTDHQVRGEKVLPAVAYLEMARAAGELAVEHGAVTQIKDVVWLRPLVVKDAPLKTQLSLHPAENGAVAYEIRTRDDTGQAVVHGQGKLIFEAVTEAVQVIDLEAIRQRCPEQKTGEMCYRQFKQQGVAYGPSFQVIEDVVMNATEALARLRLPTAVSGEAYGLHPSLLDGMLQSVTGLMEDGSSSKLYLPFALDTLELLAPLPASGYAYVTRLALQPDTAHFNIALLDEEGRVCLKLHNVTLKAIAPTEPGWYYRPYWERQALAETRLKTADAKGSIVLVVPKEMEALDERLVQHYPDRQIVRLIMGDRNVRLSETDWEIDLTDSAGMADSLNTLAKVDTLYFLGGLSGQRLDAVDLNDLAPSQERGVINLFRLVKLLEQHRRLAHVSALKVLTDQAQQCHPQETVRPWSASLSGLTMSLAKEYPAVEVSCIDVILTTNEAGQPVLAEADVMALAAEGGSHGQPVALRQGVRYVRQLAPLKLPEVEALLYRPGGVYLILGGAGGIGLETAVHLAGQSQAKLVLVGRSALTPDREAQLKRIRAAGGDYLYCQADGADLAQMQEVVRQAKETFGAINGVIHSALVLRDGPISTMDEATFQAALAPKITASVVLAEVVKDEALDFMLFFSSSQSFWGNAGQGNYAAGSTFADAYALYLNQIRPYPVKIINWGYWGSVGVVATEAYRQRLAEQGIRSIEVEAGLAAIDQILAGSLVQVAAIKADRPVLEPMGVAFEHRIEVMQPAYASVMAETVRQVTAKAQSSDQPVWPQEQAGIEALDAVARRGLLQAFQQMGVWQNPGERYSRQALAQQLNILPKYQRFYDACLHILAQGDYLTLTETEISTTANVAHLDRLDLSQQQEALVQRYPLLRPHLTLLETCLQALPDIVRGQVLATEVIFPNSSPELVEGIYQGTPVADYVNRLTASAVKSYIEQRLPALKPEEKIRIVEIGAGTGGTTGFVLAAIEPHREHLDYLYSDISQGFTRYGQSRFAEKYPFMHFEPLDIERPPAAQGFDPNQAEIVLGANVVHATQNIHHTLQNLKALLKPNGLLILNEITRFTAFTTLTFGLLDGWWAFEDGEQRLEHTPLLSPAQWQRVLDGAGFKQIHVAGQVAEQALILAESDGVVQLEQGQTGPARMTSTIRPPRPARERPQEARVPVFAPVHSTQNFVERTIIEIVSTRLHIKPENIEIDLPYTDLGIDSILAIEIVNQISQQLNIDLRPTDLFNYADIKSLSAHIMATSLEKLAQPVSPQEPVSPAYRPVERLFEHQEIRINAPARGSAGERGRSETQKPQTGPDHGLDIAIIGLSGRFPGAGDTATFWQNLAEGRNAISEVTDRRWPDADFYSPDRPTPGKSYSKWAGLLADIDRFDPLFFNLSPREAELMDPQQRLFLQEAWAALEDAGYAGSSVAGKKCGVFVGCTAGDYQQQLANAGITEAYTFMGNSTAILAARIAYHLNLKGPSIAIDTACSSSLVAIHLACESLRSGSSEMALAGGVSILTTPGFHILASQTGMLSAQGQCRTFAQGADGFVPGEGVGVVVLKALPQALADGDPIYGVIKGSAINQDGKTNGITAPNGPSQTALEGEVYEQYGIDPATISYVEAHGTGTALGDPIEVGALTDAFRQYTDKTGFCALGSVKTNIGHTLTAAGVAGVIKVLLALKHKKLPPSLHFETPNEHIDFENSPFYVNTELRDWDVTHGPRRAAVSSFGFSGTNAHVVIEEYQGAEAQGRRDVGEGPHLIVLSARNEERLRAYAEKLLAFLEPEQGIDRGGTTPAIQQTVRAMVAEMMGVAPAEIETEQAFVGYGLDPVQLSRLKTMVEEHYQCELPTTLFSGQASVRGVAQHLALLTGEGECNNQAVPQSTLSLASIAYTLQVGREAMEERLALVVSSVEELAERLSQYQQKQGAIAGLYRGNTKTSHLKSELLIGGEAGAAFIRIATRNRELERLAQLWVSGVEIEWGLLYGAAKPARISLPTYPFARERYWIQALNNETGQGTSAGFTPSGSSAAPRKMVLLAKAWEMAERSQEKRADKGRVAILATVKTQPVAEELATALPGALILMPAQVGQFVANESAVWSDISGYIDLTSLDTSYSADQAYAWIQGLQQLIEHSGQATLHLLQVTSRLEAYQNNQVQIAGARRAVIYRLLSSEYGKVSSRHLDTDLAIDDTETMTAQILAEWQQRGEEVEVCYREGARYRSTVQEIRGEEAIKAAAQTSTGYPADQVLWITGGTRGLGMLCASHFVKQHGIRKVVLMGKQALPQRETWPKYLSDPEADPILRQKIRDIQILETAGAEVLVLTGSLTDKAEMLHHKKTVNQTMGPVFGIIHCAGLVSRENPAFIRKGMAEIERVCAPKVRGLEVLHEVFATEPLHFFVLFSSVSAIIPTLGVGQSDYAMANAYMDYFAGHQYSRGQTHYVSIQWPNWHETGMGVVKSNAYRNSGLLSHTDEEGLTLLDAVLALKPGPVVLPAVVHNPEVGGQFCPEQLLRPRLELEKTPGTGSLSPNGSMALDEKTIAWFKSVLSQELKLPEERLEIELAFQDYGVDSIMLAQLVTRIERELPGMNLDPSIILEYPTIKSLSGYLVETYPKVLGARLGAPGPVEEMVAALNGRENADPEAESQRQEPEARVARIQPSVRERARIAVVGLACHFPDAPTLQQYWANLKGGRDSIREVPGSRWDVEQYYHPQTYRAGKSISKWGAFLDGIKDFDPTYFGISEALAPQIDPLERQWLEVSAEALADAGYGRRDLWGQAVGVFVGSRVGNFAGKLANPQKDALVGLGQNFIAAHLAHLYNFTGPNMVVDTACASSLTAIHLALQSLSQGESTVALAGGVDILLDEAPYLALSAAQVLSPDGRCKTFDETANGIGLGEGCGVLVLKRLEQAIADGNKIYGVIEGSAVNQDGYTMGVTTPNPAAQQALIETALGVAQANPRTITYVETHGTGTLIGDPIELKGLSKAFMKDTNDRQFCGIGSVKSNLGHLLSAAGAAGIIKVLLSITHQQLPPTLHCQHPNPRFSFAESPFYPVQHLTEWSGAAGIHRAGVSAFGLGGHNAHLIVSDEGIPASHRADLVPRGKPVVFARKRYWPTSAAEDMVVEGAQEPHKAAHQEIADDDSKHKETFMRFFEVERI